MLLQLSPSDWSTVEESLKLLKIFMLSTKEAEGDHSLLSEVIPFCKKLKLDLGSAPDTLSKFKEAALFHLQK